MAPGGRQDSGHAPFGPSPKTFKFKPPPVEGLVTSSKLGLALTPETKTPHKEHDLLNKTKDGLF